MVSRAGFRKLFLTVDFNADFQTVISETGFNNPILKIRF